MKLKKKPKFEIKNLKNFKDQNKKTFGISLFIIIIKHPTF
jgi:hypothetical protein